MKKSFIDLQDKIKNFSVKRNWNKNNLILTYNMLCNISEECGEIWSLIKWISEEKDLTKVVDMKRDDLKDGIGDLLWCIARMANTFDVDMYEALEATINEYEGRFPVDVVKNKSGNRLLGGYDGKYDKKK